mgnify:CR=1 FL=1
MIYSDLTKLQVLFEDKKNAKLALRLLEKLAKKKE